MTGRVLVTGAAGFIGRSLVARLAAGGWHVRAATRRADALASMAGLEVVEIGDLSEPIDWFPLLSGVSHVVHLAGIAHATSSIPEATYHAVNASSIEPLARAARDLEIARIVLMSSVRAQCGPTSSRIVTELDAPAPIDPYGRSKLAGERALAATLAGCSTDWCVLRPVVVYGDGVKANMRAMARLATLPLPLPVGAFSARRSVLGLDNLTSAVIHALTSAAVSRGTYLLADPTSLTIPEMIGAMRRGLGRAPSTFAVPLASIGLAARLFGKAEAWQRLTGDLIVSTARLEASGWRPVESSLEGLAGWMRRGRSAAG